MDLGLNDRVVLVTGSSKGIGKAAALQFAEEGALVAITYRHEQARADEVVNQIRAANGKALSICLDLGSFDSIAQTIERVLAEWGHIDVLVNNAIQWGSRPIAETPPFEALCPAEWQHLLRVNIEGTFRLIQGVVPAMREQSWGRVVNVSSIVAEDGLSRGAWYSTVKSAFHGLTRTLSKELGPAGILVNTVMPGLTATDRIALVAPEVRRRVEENSPIRRVLSPGDVANVIAFLSSSRIGGMTGEIVRVSGGRS